MLEGQAGGLEGQAGRLEVWASGAPPPGQQPASQVLGGLRQGVLGGPGGGEEEKEKEK